jgi:hypothetical protein
MVVDPNVRAGQDAAWPGPGLRGAWLTGALYLGGLGTLLLLLGHGSPSRLSTVAGLVALADGAAAALVPWLAGAWRRAGANPPGGWRARPPRPAGPSRGAHPLTIVVVLLGLAAVVLTVIAVVTGR